MKKICLLLAAMLISFGCGNSTEEARNEAPPPAVNTEEKIEKPEQRAYTSGANPKDDVISATQRLQEVPSWSATITSEINPEVNAQMEYLAPDRYRIQKAGGEVVIIGSESWVNENGEWQKLEDDLGELIRLQTEEETANAIETLEDVQIAGTEKVNGKEATVYSHQNGDTVTKVWIAKDSGLQLKNEIAVTEGGKTKKQITVYNYDKPVRIEPPPVK